MKSISLPTRSIGCDPVGVTSRADHPGNSDSLKRTRLGCADAWRLRLAWLSPCQTGAIGVCCPATVGSAANNHANCETRNWRSSAEPLVELWAIRFIPLHRTWPGPTLQRATTTRPPTFTNSVAPGRNAPAELAPHPPPWYPKLPKAESAVPSTTTGAEGSRVPHCDDGTGRTAGDWPPFQSGSTYCQPVSMNNLP